MRKQSAAKKGEHLDGATQVRGRAERYFVDHPGSPSAVRRPQLSQRDGTFIVLLGRNIRSGIVGLGNTVESALRALDVQYLRALPPKPRRRIGAANRSR